MQRGLNPGTIVRPKLHKKLSIGCIIALTIVGIILTTCIGQNNEPEDSGQSAPPRVRDKPIIIWFHGVNYNSFESLKYVLSSGMVTHVMVLYMHRADANWKTSDETLQAIKMVKDSKAKLIWCRDLWPYYKNEGIKLSDFFDPNYYVREITYLRAEGKQIGADFVAIDTEPYGYSPMKRYLKSDTLPNTQQRELLRQVIAGVVKRVGKVDFVLPAGTRDLNHPYNILSAVGENRICEGTYYFNYHRLRTINYPYEIFGAYVNTVRENAEHRELPFFLVSDVFEHSELWAGKKGLFLYSDRQGSLKAAMALWYYSKTSPFKVTSSGSEQTPPDKR